MKITKRWIKSNNACNDSLEWFEQQDSFDAKILFDSAIKSERFSDINWVLTKKMNRSQLTLYSIYAAEKVLENFEKIFPDDGRPRIAIESAKKYLENPSFKTKEAARSAAESAESAALSAAYIDILKHGFNILMDKK